MDLVRTIVLLLTLLASPALAAPDDAAGQAELRRQLEQARERLDEAARQVAELSTRLGEDRIVHFRHIGHRRPMLGLVLGPDPDGRGVRLQAVTPDGPADRAGLRSGDVLTAIDGQAIAGDSAEQRVVEAQSRLSGLAEDQVVALAYRRAGQAAQVSVTAERLAPQAFLGGLGGIDGLRGLDGLDGRINLDIDIERLRADLESGMAGIEKRIQVIGPMIEETIRFDAWRWQGLRLAPLDADLGSYFGTDQGVLVLKADGEALAGLRSGDIIQSIDGEAVTEPRQAMRLLARAEPGDRLQLDLLRERRSTRQALTAPERPDPMRWLGRPPTPPAPPAPPAAPTAPPPPAPAPPPMPATLI